MLVGEEEIYYNFIFLYEYFLYKEYYKCIFGKLRVYNVRGKVMKLFLSIEIKKYVWLFFFEIWGILYNKRLYCIYVLVFL